MFVIVNNKSSFTAAEQQKRQNDIVFIKDTQEIWTHGTYFTIPDSYVEKITDAESAIEAIKSNSPKTFNITASKTNSNYTFDTNTTYTTNDNLNTAKIGDCINITDSSGGIINYLVITKYDSILYLASKEGNGLYVDFENSLIHAPFIKSNYNKFHVRVADFTDPDTGIKYTHKGDIDIFSRMSTDGSIMIGLDNLSAGNATSTLSIGSGNIVNTKNNDSNCNIVLGSSNTIAGPIKNSICIGNNLKVNYTNDQYYSHKVVAIGASNDRNENVVIGHNKNIIVTEDDKFGVKKANKDEYIYLEDELHDIDTDLDTNSTNPVQNKAVSSIRVYANNLVSELYNNVILSLSTTEVSNMCSQILK